MRDIVSSFGSNNAFALSVDGKAKVTIGATAVTKQATFKCMLALKFDYQIMIL